MSDAEVKGSNPGGMAPTTVALVEGEQGQSLRVSLGSHLLVIERTPEGGALKLVSADGREPIEIEVTAAGAVLRLRAGLTIAVDGGIGVEANAVAIHARDSLSLTSGGRLSLAAHGEMQSEGRSQRIAARLGDVLLTANDDVVVQGERIKLNS